MTVAFGNLIVVIIAEGKFLENQVNEYFLFAGLLGCATIAFAVLTFFYKYHDPPSVGNDDKKSDGEVAATAEGKEGLENVAYSKASIDSDIKLVHMRAFDPN